MDTSATEEKHKLISDTGKTSLLIGLGVASKAVVDLVVAASFGLGAQTDAFFVAFTLPLVIEALSYHTCQSGLVPIFVRYLLPEQENSRWQLFDSVFNLGFLISGALVAVGIFGAPWMVRLVAPGAAEDTIQLAVRLTRILFIGTLFIGPVGVMRAFLNAHKMFTAPALLELARGGAVLSTMALAYRNETIDMLAIGFVVGGVAQFLLLGGVIMVKFGFKYRPIIKLSSLRSTRTGSRLLVPFVDYLLVQTVAVIQRVVGSFLPPGSISAISYGHRMSSVVGVMLFSGVEVVSLPSLAADLTHETLKHLNKATKVFVMGLRLVLILGIPVAVGIFSLNFPLTQLLFQRGAFNQQATQLAAPVLGIYALCIPFYGCWMLSKNYFFAALQPKKVLATSVLIVVVNLALALWWWQPFGTQGVAAAYVGGMAAACALSFLLLDTTLELHQKELTYLAAKVIGASVVMGFMAYAAYDLAWIFLDRVQTLPDMITLTLSLLVAGIVGVISLGGTLMSFKVEEIGDLLSFLKRPRTIRVRLLD